MAWTPGAEVCGRCGFIPIGAGLKAQAQAVEDEPKVRDRAIEIDLGLEREPGSRPGLILSALLLVLISISYDRKIWVNDWEQVRVLLGAQPSADIQGNWGITTSEQLDREGIAAGVQGLTGDFLFAKNGTTRIHLYRGLQEMEATGTYSQSGASIRLKHLEGNNGSTPLPDDVTLNVVWRKGNQMALDIQGQERVILQRVEP